MRAETPNPSDIWPTKTEAALKLGASIRTVERWIDEGKLTARPKPVPGRKPLITIDPQDVDRIISETRPQRVIEGSDHKPREARQGFAELLVDSETARLLAKNEREERATALAAACAPLVERIADALRPAEPAKPWLTLAEAAEFSGLPASWLLARARLGSHPESAADKMYADPAGCVVAVNVGTGTREFWRFNRAALAK